jgi:hypothetical protein
MNSLRPWLEQGIERWHESDPDLSAEIQRKGGKAQLTKRVRLDAVLPRASIFPL